jgi:hypothetical protein
LQTKDKYIRTASGVHAARMATHLHTNPTK